ncbi:hypothetical protein BGZ83_005662 [Gryganskiella cystojenkinii]|nr:hypothetical protein BGZ83_005662 [Gryganskiella cystojenkinii]
MELGQLPRRETDNAIIISNATRMYKLHASSGEVKIVKRGDKFEKQYRLSCQRCHLLIAYETTPHLKGGPYTYIVQGALNEIQGVPHEDWELDLPHGPEADQEAPTLSIEDEEQLELQRRMKQNQAAAANARAMFLASAGAGSSSSSS